jgi:anti-sigma regulatory factor (Ser/Thr protein kinase)
MKCLHVNPNDIAEIFEKIEQAISILDDALRFKIMLICEEIITNQIRHANFENRVQEIEFCFDFKNPNSIVLVFKDNAKEFNPLEANDPDLTTNIEETKLGGLGIFMVKKYSKELRYDYKEGCNILSVIL